MIFYNITVNLIFLYFVESAYLTLFYGGNVVTISQKILSIMEEKHITQKKLSEFAGISTSAISDWKKKGTNPSVDKISAIADCLEVSVDYLLDRTSDPQGYTNNHISHSDNIALGENASVNIQSSNDGFDETKVQVAKEFSNLNFFDKVKVMNLIAELRQKAN